ncbi:uncharacterized protein LOC129775402 [Toxorhynchites rutilus septentrionalis]|uniref:uncharacterized protein LOC129775402 n=1 Tax=Toxorhynchites rutilus septentrionalis TaxID=329112 RepID=UPI00247A78AD|nr:uncharacterized protein LOC129775402 [Toxorhynchites rutilus septentrionalis]
MIKSRWKLPLIVLLSVNCALISTEDKFSSASAEDSIPDDVDGHKAHTGETLISAQLFAIIDLYKQEDPVGLPGATVPDPMPIPEIQQSFSIAKMHMKNVLAYGLSKFRIKFFTTELNTMKVQTAVQIDEMQVKGNYTMSTFFNRAEGPFTVVLKNVLTKGNVSLGVERDGKVRTQDISLDITFDDMSMDFQNLGFMGSIFQSVVNSASNLVFDTIKPFMLNEAYTKIRAEIDTRVENLTTEHSIVFPNSISPLDMAIGEARALVRNKKFDPYLIPDYNTTAGIFGMHTAHTWIRGVSSFYRYGDIGITMQNNTVALRMQVGTQRIMGSTQWEVSVGRGMISRAGQAQFTVEHIKVAFEVHQPLDLRRKPKLYDLQLELGNIQVRCDGAGTLDYVIEAVVNILPNLLRYQIMDAIENPLKARIQEKLDCVNVEQMIKKHVLEYEKQGFDMEIDLKIC